MRRRLGSVVAAALAAVAVDACNGTTGDQLVSFAAYAAGARGAGQPFSVDGYTVERTRICTSARST